MLKAISTITNALGALNYKGTWNASSNTPTLADGTGAKGDYYVVSTAGTQTFGGVQLFFGTGDWIAYNGAVWQRVEGGSDGNFANVTLTSTDAGANEAPTLDLYRDSATPTAADTLAEIQFNGEDSAGNKQKYACIHGSILSPTSGSEQGQIHFETQTAGASTEKMIIGTTNLVINEIGAVFNVRIEGDADANLFTTDATNDRIGVGTISPSVKFEVNGIAKATSVQTDGGSAGAPAYSFAGDTDNGLYRPTTNELGISTAGVERLRFLSSGTILSGTTDDSFFAGSVTGIGLYGSNGFIAASRNGALSGLFNRFTSEGDVVQFRYAGSAVGSVSVTALATTYNTLSDYRLKTIVGLVTGQGERIDALKPIEYTWNSNGSQTRGFLAHEFKEVYADSVTGKKDAVDDDGNPVYQSMQAGSSEVIADLIAELQSLRKRVASLEAK